MTYQDHADAASRHIACDDAPANRVATLARMLDELSADDADSEASIDGLKREDVGADVFRQVNGLFRDALRHEIEQALEREAGTWARSVVGRVAGEDAGPDSAQELEPSAQSNAMHAVQPPAPHASDQDPRIAGLADALGFKEREVLGYLLEHPAATQEEIAESLFMSRSTVAGYTVALQEKGYLSRAGSRRMGHWIVDL